MEEKTADFNRCLLSGYQFMIPENLKLVIFLCFFSNLSAEF